MSRGLTRAGLIWIGAVVLPLYALDQMTKGLTLAHLGYEEAIPVIPGLFNLVHYTNTGAAFGSFQNAPTFFLLLSLGALGVLGILAWRGAFREWPTRAAAALLAAGVLGNVTDRLRFGHVIDFLEFHVGAHYWPAFNVADSCICVAVALFLWASLTEKRADN